LKYNVALESPFVSHSPAKIPIDAQERTRRYRSVSQREKRLRERDTGVGMNEWNSSDETDLMRHRNASGDPSGDLRGGVAMEGMSTNTSPLRKGVLQKRLSQSNVLLLKTDSMEVIEDMTPEMSPPPMSLHLKEHDLDMFECSSSYSSFIDNDEAEIFLDTCATSNTGPLPDASTSHSFMFE